MFRIGLSLNKIYISYIVTMFSVRVIKCFASSVHVEWRQRGTLKLKRVLPTKVTSLYDLRVKVFRYTHCQHDSHFLPPRWGLLLLLRSHKQKTPRWTNPKTATTWGSNHNWKKTKNKSNILSSAFWSVYQPKVLHLNTKNAFIFFPFVHFFSNKTGQIWKMIIWNSSCAVWLYCYNPSCSCFILFLKRQQVSEWWWKQQRNERDLTSPPSSPSTPASEMILLQERCCKGIFQGGKKTCGHRENNSRKVQSLLYLWLALHPHILFGIQKRWRPLRDLKLCNSASRTPCPHPQV